MSLIRGDARALPLGAGVVDCVVTSPPYWGLRDYGMTEQIGLEATPAAYVASLVRVFQEVCRVLKDTGTVWLNLGDSYAAHPGQRKTTDTIGPKQATNAGSNSVGSRSADGFKAKDLVGIPWRVAFALQAEGWYLRSDIIWAKPNPMPESVTDRPTRAHEYLFLLTKSERYAYDAGSIRELSVKTGTLKHLAGGDGVRAGSRAGLRRDEWLARKRLQEPGFQALGHIEVSGEPLDFLRTKHRTVRPSDTRGGGQGHGAMTYSELDRNRRSVWTVPTEPYAGAHFATMPEALVEPCILAGCPLGGLVLDPFVGSGTVGAVAERLGRRWVGVDLTYQDLATTRTAQRGLRW